MYVLSKLRLHYMHTSQYYPSTHKICPKGTLGAGRIGLGRAAKVRQGERMLQAPADGMEVGEPLSWVYWRTPSH